MNKKVLYLALFIMSFLVACKDNPTNPVDDIKDNGKQIVWEAPPVNSHGFAIITSFPDSLLKYDNLRILGAADERVAWVGDWAENFLLKTENGGTSWIVQKPPLSGEFNTIYCIEVLDSLTLWIGTVGGEILKSENGGYTWTLQHKSNFVDYIKFFDKNKGIALCDAQQGEGPLELLHTSDGGKTWVNKNSTLSYGTTHYAVSFTDTNNGWIKTEPGNKFVHYTTDGGVSWDTVYIDNIGFIITLYSPVAGSCIVAGENNVYITQDFGNSFAKLENIPSGTFGRIKKADNLTGGIYSISGDSPLISKDYGVNWEKINTGRLVKWWDDISAPKKNVVWLSGNPNKITYTVKADSLFGI